MRHLTPTAHLCRSVVGLKHGEALSYLLALLAHEALGFRCSVGWSVGPVGWWISWWFADLELHGGCLVNCLVSCSVCLSARLFPHLLCVCIYLFGWLVVRIGCFCRLLPGSWASLCIDGADAAEGFVILRQNLFRFVCSLMSLHVFAQNIDFAAASRFRCCPKRAAIRVAERSRCRVSPLTCAAGAHSNSGTLA